MGYLPSLLGQDGWILANLFLNVYGLCSIKSQKNEQGQYPGILTEQAWSIKHLIYRNRL